MRWRRPKKRNLVRVRIPLPELNEVITVGDVTGAVVMKHLPSIPGTNGMSNLNFLEVFLDTNAKSVHGGDMTSRRDQ